MARRRRRRVYLKPEEAIGFISCASWRGSLRRGDVRRRPIALRRQAPAVGAGVGFHTALSGFVARRLGAPVRAVAHAGYAVALVVVEFALVAL